MLPPYFTAGLRQMSCLIRYRKQKIRYPGTITCADPVAAYLKENHLNRLRHSNPFHLLPLLSLFSAKLGRCIRKAAPCAPFISRRLSVHSSAFYLFFLKTRSSYEFVTFAAFEIATAKRLKCMVTQTFSVVKPVNDPLLKLLATAATPPTSLVINFHQAQPLRRSHKASQ